jgi:sulfhydrogenase subunit beta (sulfur reductase)
MCIYKLKKEKTADFLKELKKSFAVFAPIKSEAIVSFEKLESDLIPNINLQRTHKPPKEIFLPQTETLLSFDKVNIEAALYKGKPIAVFGAKPCDSRSFLTLERVFIDSKYTDTYWSKRRKNQLIFTIGCTKPISTCFCNWFNGSPFSSTGTDVLITDLGNTYLFEPQTKDGTDYLANSEILKKADNKDLELAETVKRKAESLMEPPPNLESLKKNLDTNLNHAIWEQTAVKCLGCSICTFTCPTCHCFDIQDESRRNKGKRIRIWDTCQLPLFTKEGSGHNSRPTQKERIRQRFLHKLSYMQETQNDFGCVGCGRCVALCPVGIDLRDFIKKALQLKENKNES